MVSFRVVIGCLGTSSYGGGWCVCTIVLFSYFLTVFPVPHFINFCSCNPTLFLSPFNFVFPFDKTIEIYILSGLDSLSLYIIINIIILSVHFVGIILRFLYVVPPLTLKRLCFIPWTWFLPNQEKDEVSIFYYHKTFCFLIWWGWGNQWGDRWMNKESLVWLVYVLASTFFCVSLHFLLPLFWVFPFFSFSLSFSHTYPLCFLPFSVPYSLFTGQNISGILLIWCKSDSLWQTLLISWLIEKQQLLQFQLAFSSW